MAGRRPAAQLWRHLMAVDLSFYTSPISEEIRDEGRAEGRADALLIVLEQRGVAVPDEARDRITRCGDPEQLRRWLARAVTAASVEDVIVEP
ncbi:hypothetical protein [Streptomyces lavendulocolor]|uniref:hypothetical protein n=1 Tax=Streptomyces lavendulocolor TaxID=67316 RepID=UPI003C3036D6